MIRLKMTSKISYCNSKNNNDYENWICHIFCAVNRVRVYVLKFANTAYF